MKQFVVYSVQFTVCSLLFTALCSLITVSPVHAATLSLSPTSLEIQETNQGVLTLNLDPQSNQVIGADVFLTYNPERLKVVSIQNRTTIPGNPATVIDNDRGVTKFSLINPYGAYTLTPGPLADITVQPLTDQATTLAIQFTPGNTADSNVAIADGFDALIGVTNATIVVTGTGSPSPSATSAPTATPAPKNTTILPDLNPAPPGFDSAVKSTRNNQLISPIPEELLATPSGKLNAPGLTKPNTPDTPGRILGQQDEPLTAQASSPFPWYTLNLSNVLPLILGLAALVAGVVTYVYFKRRYQSPPQLTPTPGVYSYSVSY